MKVAFRKLRVIAAIGMFAAAIVLTGPASARAGSVLVGAVTTDAGQPLTKDSIMKIADVNGSVMQLTLTTPGTYKADTTSLQPPLLIQAGDIYGYSVTGSGVSNVTPFSDLIVNQIYQAYGTNAPTQFMSSTPRKITPIQLQATWSLDKDVFQQAYTNYKISPTFNLFTSKFSYSKGFGQLLSHSTVTGFGTATQMVHTALPAVDFTATFLADSGIHWSTSVWKSQLPSSGPYSVSSGYTVIPTDPNAGATYGGVNNFYKFTFLPILNHERKLVDSVNLLPLYSPSYLNSGKDQSTQSEFDATDWRPLKFTKIALGLIRDYRPNFPDSSHNVINLAVDYTESLNGGSFTKRRYQDFICNTDGSGCLFFGNQQLGGTCSEIKVDLDSILSGLLTPVQELRATLTSPQGTFSSVDLSDALGSYFINTPMTMSTKTIMLQPFHNLPPISYMQDEFRLKTTLSAPFVYNNQFSYFAQINPTGSAAYDSYVFGYTFEPINWLAPDVNGSHLLSDFKLGVPTVVKFLPPLTFLPLRVELNGIACNATQSIDLGSTQKFISPTAKSGSIIVPKMVLSNPTVGFEFNLRYEGLYGQNSLFKYGVGAACP